MTRGLPRMLPLVALVAILFFGVSFFRPWPIFAADTASVPCPVPQPPAPAPPSPAPAPTTTPPRILFSEIYRHVSGSDRSGEFIEIMNGDTVDVTLHGWTIKDTKQRVFHIPDGLVLPSTAVHAFLYAETRIPLVKAGGQLTIVAPDGTNTDLANYPADEKGLSYVRDANGAWTTTDIPTPGGTNIIHSDTPPPPTETPTPPEAPSPSPAPAAPPVATPPMTTPIVIEPLPTAPPVSIPTPELPTPPPTTPIHESAPIIPPISPLPMISTPPKPTNDFSTITQHKPESPISLSGVVTAPPGRVGATIFGLQDETAGKSVYIQASGAIPAMKIGSTVTLSGTYHRTEARTWVSAKGADITVAISAAPITSAQLAIHDIMRDRDALAASIQGVVTKKGSTWLTVTEPTTKKSLRITFSDQDPFHGSTATTTPIGATIAAEGTIRFEGSTPTLVAIRTFKVLSTPKPKNKPLTQASAALTQEPTTTQTNPAPHSPDLYTTLLYGISACGAGAITLILRRRTPAAKDPYSPEITEESEPAR